MKRMLASAISTALVVTAASTAQAQPEIVRPTGDGQWYYAIGGGDPMLYYHQSNKTTISLGAGAEWNLFRGCSFDPSFGIFDTFNNIEENVYGMANDVMENAVAVFAGWGLSKIAENWPQQYDFISKGLKDAKESFQLSVKTCRDVQNDMRAGRNPVDGWVSVARKSSWARAAQDGENPVVAEKEIEENAGEGGLPWADDQNAGGRNADGTLQPPIRAVADVVRAGYEHLVDPNPAATPDPAVNEKVTGDKNIPKVFPTADEAAEWATEVVGEREIRTCRGCEQLRTYVGQGLRFQYRKEREPIQEALADVMASTTPVSADALNDLSVPAMGVVVSSTLVRQLKSAPFDEQTILANRLVGEIALGRAVEKALIIRDLMNAGAQEPNIAAAGDVAKTEINYALERLQQEIDNVLFEADVRKKVLTSAAGTISEMGNKREARPEVLDVLSVPIKDRTIRDGAIEE